MATPHTCEECRQPVVLKVAAYPAFFGHVISPGDWGEFMYAGLCSLCTYILADFAAMKDRKGTHL